MTDECRGKKKDADALAGSSRGGGDDRFPVSRQPLCASYLNSFGCRLNELTAKPIEQVNF